jgi:hypothetical protein
MTKARFTPEALAQALTEFTRECETTVREISQGKNGAITERRIPGAPLREYTPPKTQPKEYDEQDERFTD